MDHDLFLLDVIAQINAYDRNIQNGVVILTPYRLSMLKKEKSKRLFSCINYIVYAEASSKALHSAG